MEDFYGRLLVTANTKYFTAQSFMLRSPSLAGCFHGTSACLVPILDHNTMWAEVFWRVQVEMHAHWRNDRLLKWCNQQGIHVSAYAPLSSPQTMEGMGKDVPNLMEVSYAACL